MLLSETLTMVKMNIYKDIFFGDKLARAWLLFIKVIENEKFLQLSNHLNEDIFELELNFPPVNEDSFRKRAGKAAKKQDSKLEAAI